MTKRVLITVKAPPTPSKNYQETNCCAGIDLDSGKWIRLYPIPFRLLGSDQQFPKYSIIKVKCQRPIRDKRIESYKADQDSIEILSHLDTKNRWSERKKIILPTVSSSFCKILEDIKIKKSLGVFKPTDISFYFKKTVSKSKVEHQMVYNQHRLFDRKLKPIEQIPFAFYYKFKCFNQPNCLGHDLKIHDWEITQSFRSWRHRYKDQEELLEKIKERWLDMCSSKKDAYFFVGNMWKHPKRFMVLGVFYPQKTTEPTAMG